MEQSKLEKLVSLLPEGRPIGKTFETSGKKYFYDTPTGKVMECSNGEYEIIKKILSGGAESILGGRKEESNPEDTAIEHIISAVEHENILKLSKFSRMDIQDDYKEMLDSHMNQLIIELTERCNLRCGYCIYSEDCEKSRDFGERDITEETAFKAVDYIFEHSAAAKDLHITFYGGEPLICYDIMKKTIDYAIQRNSDGRELHFSFTTNAVMLTEKIAEELAQYPNVSILVSLDGPQQIHDLYRVDIAGNGTFDRTLRGLRFLVEAFGDRSEECISLSMVYGPPFSSEKLETIQKFFKGLDWFPEGIRKQITYPTPESMISVRRHLTSKGIEIGNGTYDSSLVDWTHEKYNPDTRSELFTSDLIEQKFLKINKRQVFDGIMDYMCLNGCCMPGQRRLYVTVDGKFKACERVGSSPYIGDLENGMDLEVIEEKYLFGYAEQSYEKCSTCWLGRLCDLCYAQCFDSDGLNLKQKEEACHERLVSFYRAFRMYFEYLESDPHMFDFLNDYIYE